MTKAAAGKRQAGVLANPKHERFAQELAKGKSQAEAYEAAGYAKSRSAASRLAEDVNICERVAELQTRVAVRTEITVAGITSRLLNIADVAEKTGVAIDPITGEAKDSSSKHLGVARAALMDAAKLNGLVVDQTETVTTTPEERRRRIAELEARRHGADRA